MSETPAPPQAGGNSTDGSALWAVIVGCAILALAALLIFSQGSSTAGKGKSDPAADGQQASHAADGTPEGRALGVGRREVDPAEARRVPKIRPGILPAGAAGNSLAPMRPPKPEPTSFPSASAEIEYYEKKLADARAVLERRETFRERMKKIVDEAPSAEAHAAAEKRAKIVEDNYNTAKKIVDDLIKKVEELKQKQRESGAR